MKRLAPFLLLLTLGCGGHSVTVTVPQCAAKPISTIVVTPGQVGQSYPPTTLWVVPLVPYTLCGVPSGMTVTVTGSHLTLTGTPLVSGTFPIWLAE